jgi:hypothetical protein
VRATEVIKDRWANDGIRGVGSGERQNQRERIGVREKRSAAKGEGQRGTHRERKGDDMY